MAKDTDKKTEKKDDKDAMEQLAMMGEQVRSGASSEVKVRNKRWKIRAISNRQADKIARYALLAKFIQHEQKREGIKPRKYMRLQTRLRKIPAKIAAHYILGRWLYLVPFLWAFMWRRLWNNSEEVSMTINATKTIRREEENFYIANLEILSYQLALSMKQVGESDKQKRERQESAESMLDEDALPKKEEDSK